MKFLAIFLAIATVIASAAIPQLPFDRQIEADAYRPSFTSELAAIAQKFQAAVQVDREWFLAYVKEHDAKLHPGDILPYHEKFGVTREEYAKFAAAASKPQIELFGRRKLKFSSDRGLVRIQIAGATPLIGEIVINSAKQTATCVVGESKPGEYVEVKSGGALGPWIGVSYDYPLPEGSIVSHGRISYGKIETGDLFLYVDLHLYTNGERRDFSVIYRWPDLKPNHTPEPALSAAH